MLTEFGFSVRKSRATISSGQVESRNWEHCLRRVYARARETLEVVVTDRLPRGRRRSNAAQLRAVPATHDLKSFQCVHVGIQRTGSHPAIQSDGEAGNSSMLGSHNCSSLSGGVGRPPLFTSDHHAEGRGSPELAYPRPVSANRVTMIVCGTQVRLPKYNLVPSLVPGSA